MRIIAFAAPLAAVMVVGCSPESTARAEAEHATRAMLKDPPSARFGPSFVITRPADHNGVQETVVCGIVDGKNGFGGYTGGSRYVVSILEGGGATSVGQPAIDDNDRRAALGTHETVFERVYWNPMCTDATHPKQETARDPD